MLDQLFDSFKGDAISNLTAKAGISTDQAEQVLPIAKTSIQSGLMEQVTGGNVAGILSMFNRGSGSAMSDSPVFGSIKKIFVGNLLAKMGLPPAVANIIAGSGLENIMGSLSGALKGDSGQVTESGLMEKLGLGGGLKEMAQNIAQDKLGGLAKGKLGDIAGGLFK